MRLDACPKDMTYGPCGGVRVGGDCEVPGVRCPFLESHEVRHLTVPFRSPPSFPVAGPWIVVDVRSPQRWGGDVRALWAQIGERLDGCVALLGEHVDNPVRRDDSGTLAPQEVISILAAAGRPVIATITGRDRTLVEASNLMSSYVSAGATAIHCVTGDHPAALGIDRPATFGTEAVELVAVAAELGYCATVGESPASPGDRVKRVQDKATAGAALCVLNHAGGPDDLIEFTQRCRIAGVRLPFVAPLPMVGDKRAALGLAAFPGVRLPHGYLDTIIEADHPLEASVGAARNFARQLAASGAFGGINLSGSATGTDPWERLESTTMFVDAVAAGWLR